MKIIAIFYPMISALCFLPTYVYFFFDVGTEYVWVTDIIFYCEGILNSIIYGYFSYVKPIVWKIIKNNFSNEVIGEIDTNNLIKN